LHGQNATTKQWYGLGLQIILTFCVLTTALLVSDWFNSSLAVELVGDCFVGIWFSFGKVQDHVSEDVLGCKFVERSLDLP
jgi:hypothetical protein